LHNPISFLAIVEFRLQDAEGQLHVDHYSAMIPIPGDVTKERGFFPRTTRILQFSSEMQQT
jgi:hypothetical protein